MTLENQRSYSVIYNKELSNKKLFEKLIINNYKKLFYTNII